MCVENSHYPPLALCLRKYLIIRRLSRMPSHRQSEFSTMQQGNTGFAVGLWISQGEKGLKGKYRESLYCGSAKDLPC